MDICRILGCFRMNRGAVRRGSEVGKKDLLLIAVFGDEVDRLSEGL